MVEALPNDVEDSVARLAELHHAHERSTSRVQRLANRLTHALGRPVALAIVCLVVIAWMIGNYLGHRLGRPPLEEFPCPDLAFVATVSALLILTTQRHQDQLAERCAQLTLEIALLGEKKVAKFIALLEEQRRETPLLASRVDEEADALAQPVDPLKSLEELDRRI